MRQDVVGRVYPKALGAGTHAGEACRLQASKYSLRWAGHVACRSGTRTRERQASQACSRPQDPLFLHPYKVLRSQDQHALAIR